MPRPGLRELIATGRLHIGAEVFHEGRQHKDRSVSGRIQAGGIEVGGVVYGSPSGAARAVTGTAAENGWVWWRLRSTGRPLSELRE